MNISSLIAVAFAAAVAVSKAEELPGWVFRFANQDQISGTLLSLTRDQLTLNSPVLEVPAVFFVEKLMDVKMTAAEPESSAKHAAVVKLTNGDVVHGEVLNVSDEVVELETWFAGRLKLNRLMVSDITITDRPNYVYRGPTGMEDWKQSGSGPKWSYHDMELRSVGVGSIARDVQLPSECAVAFDVAWKNSLNFSLVLFSDELSVDERVTSGYEVTFQQRSISLRSRKTQKYLGHQANATSLQENEKARIEVRVSAKIGKIVVLVDGAVMGIFSDPDAVSIGKGGGMHFITANDTPLAVSKIVVTEWDGDLDSLPPTVGPAVNDMDDFAAPMPVKKPLKAGRMELKNGDNLEGEVTSISGGIITLKTPFREVKLPISVLKTLALKPVNLERCKREKGDVRAHFPDGSSMVFRLENVEGDALVGYSQNFGTASFKLSGMTRMEFNIYSLLLEEIRDAVME